MTDEDLMLAGGRGDRDAFAARLGTVGLLRQQIQQGVVEHFWELRSCFAQSS